MKFPCELLAEPYLAQIRIEVAHLLNKEGYTQTKISELLQVSQPVISGYLKKSKSQEKLPQVILARAKEISVSIAEILASRGLDGTQEAIRLGCRECKIMRQAGPTCIFHQQNTDYLDDNCTSCLTETQLVELQIDKQGVLQELSNLFDKFANNENFNKIIPEIGMQIIHSVTDPQSMNDIAAFPGRIIKRKGSGPIADPPTFGSSETTSQILLDLQKSGYQINSIIAMKTSDWLENRVSKLDINYQIIEKFEENPSELLSELEDLEPPFVIIGKYSRGYESISYLCCTEIESLDNILFNVISF